MKQHSPSPSFLAFWVAFSSFAEQALREDGLNIHADILAQSSHALFEKWKKEHGEYFEGSHANFLSYSQVEGGCLQ